MQAFIDFLVNNYLWFLIITIILIFALIGYLVDTSEQSEESSNVIKNPKKEEILLDDIENIEKENNVESVPK